MSIGVLHGQNGGGIKLPFRVVGGTTQPSNPKDGTIWVKTSVPIMRTEFNNGTWDSGGVGLVFLAGTLGGSNPTGTNTTVLAINKNTGADKYILKITLTGCKQVQGSTGNWVNLDAYRYYGGTWVQFSRYNVIPEFTYTGDYEIVNDADEPITVSQDNWKIRFLTSGTLKFTDLRSAENGIDVFLVGGGGGGSHGYYHSGNKSTSGGAGGGGGYTTTAKDVAVVTGTSYEIVIGAGGSDPSDGSHNGGAGGASSAFGNYANGGDGGRYSYSGGGPGTGSGGSGGSGGGKCANTSGGVAGDGGSDGSDASDGGGKGQGTTTREFGESGKRLYAGGGAGNKGNKTGGTPGEGGGGAINEPGEANTGGGGGGGNNGAAAGTCPGGSGIVVIRNKR